MYVLISLFFITLYMYADIHILMDKIRLCITIFSSVEKIETDGV